MWTDEDLGDHTLFNTAILLCGLPTLLEGRVRGRTAVSPDQELSNGEAQSSQQKQSSSKHCKGDRQISEQGFRAGVGRYCRKECVSVSSLCFRVSVALFCLLQAVGNPGEFYPCYHFSVSSYYRENDLIQCLRCQRGWVRTHFLNPQSKQHHVPGGGGACLRYQQSAGRGR